MSTTIYISEDRKKLTLCDSVTHECLVFKRLEARLTLPTSKSIRLSKEEREEVAKRYREMPETGENAADIGRDYGISRIAVRKIGMKTELVPISIRKKVISLIGPELTSQDIADELNLPLGTVNAIIARYREIPMY